MQTVNIADIKNNLNTLLEHMQNGDELIIKDDNKLIARIVPFAVSTNSNSEVPKLFVAADGENDEHLDLPVLEMTPNEPHVSSELVSDERNFDEEKPQLSSLGLVNEMPLIGEQKEPGEICHSIVEYSNGGPSRKRYLSIAGCY